RQLEEVRPPEPLRGIIVRSGRPSSAGARPKPITCKKRDLETRVSICRCEELDKRLKTEGRSINAHENLDLLVGNIINRMLFTERFEKKEAERFFFLKKRLDDMMENASLFDMLVEEWNVNWPLIRSRTDRLLEPFYTVMDFIRNQIEQRKREIANGTHVLQGEGDDFVDAFLVQMKKDKESGVPTSFDDEMWHVTSFDCGMVGKNYNYNIGWAFPSDFFDPHEGRALDANLFFNSVKGKVEAELLSLTKGRRLLSIADRPNTPYYNATLTGATETVARPGCMGDVQPIIEIHRCASLIPMNLWRNTSEDTAVGSYVIPKGTTITAQISVIMTDEKYFKNRNEFNPDRYLNGNKLDQKVVPIRSGKEIMSRRIIANILLRYNIDADPSHKPSMKAMNDLQFFRKPQPYHIQFERRSL
ncbi:hypothetical protein COOONC_16733, partial [Cooperia oncophora]